MVAHLGMWWLIWRCGGSSGDMVAHLEMFWLIRDVVTHFGVVVTYYTVDELTYFDMRELILALWWPI